MCAMVLLLLNFISIASAKLYIGNTHMLLERGGDICCHLNNSDTGQQLTLNCAVTVLYSPQNCKFACAVQKKSVVRLEKYLVANSWSKTSLFRVSLLQCGSSTIKMWESTSSIGIPLGYRSLMWASYQTLWNMRWVIWKKIQGIWLRQMDLQCICVLCYLPFSANAGIYWGSGSIAGVMVQVPGDQSSPGNNNVLWDLPGTLDLLLFSVVEPCCIKWVIVILLFDF